MKVATYYQPGYYRSVELAKAMGDGCRRHGIEVESIPLQGRSDVMADAAIFYGFANNAPSLFQAYRAQGLPVVNMDLGYWDRDKKKRMQGYNKVAVNARHPDAYFQDRPKPSDRFDRLDVEVKPWSSNGRFILVCGMSHKAAPAAGFRFLEWEKDIIRRIREVTDIPIHFRAKPRKRGIPAKIDGVFNVSDDESISQSLKGAHICVARHSNACLDALLDGVPIHAEEGVASVMSTPLLEIENPRRPDGRNQLAYDVSYCQWTTSEMRSGDVWSHLKAESLV